MILFLNAESFVHPNRGTFRIHCCFSMMLFVLFGETGALAQTGSAWTPLYKDEHEMKKVTEGNFEMVDGLIYVPTWGKKDLVKQPSPDAAIRAKIHLKEGCFAPGLFLRSNEDASIHYTAGPSRFDEATHTYKAISLRWKNGNQRGIFPSDYILEKPIGPGDEIALEFRCIGTTLLVLLDGQPVITVQDDKITESGHWGVRSQRNGYFSDLEVQTLTPDSALPEKQIPVSSQPSTPPTMPTTSSGPPTEADKQLEALDAKFQSAYDREVGTPIASSIAELNTSYLAALDRAMTAATTGNQLDEALALREEKQLVTDAKPLLPLDDTKAPATLKNLRETYLKQITVYEQERSAKAQPVFDQYSKALDELQASFTRQNKLDEALKVRTVKEQLGDKMKSLALPWGNAAP